MNWLTTSSRIDTDALERETGFGWGWFIVLGATLIVLGALAFLNLPLVGTVSVFAVGVLMVIGALAQLGTTLLIPNWRGIGLLALSAIFYGAAGSVAIFNPKLDAMPLHVLLAFALLASGIVRIRLTSVMPLLPGWGWVAASGFVTVVCGLIFIHLLFTHPVWFLAIALAVDLVRQGAMVISFGVALKGARTAIPRR